jgi:hypothetical protein
MKKYLLILLFFFPIFVFADVDTFEGTAITSTTDIEGLSSDIDDVEGSVVASGRGNSIFSENFETDYSNNDEMSTQHSWIEDGATTNIFTVTSTGPIAGTYSGFIENDGAASDEQRIEQHFTALSSGSNDLVNFEFEFNSADTTAGYDIFLVGDGSLVLSVNRRLVLKIMNDDLQYLDDATYRSVGSVSDSTSYEVSLQIDVDDDGTGDAVRIWFNDVEVTYVDSRSGYKTRSQGTPAGIDRAAFPNENSTNCGDTKIDNLDIYEGGYVAD